MALTLGNPDFLRPIRENNREEIFLIEFHRVYKNTNMSIFRNLIKEAKKDMEMLDIFPHLLTVSKLDGPTSRYLATVLYNRPEKLVQYLSDDRLVWETASLYVEQFSRPYDLSQLHNTRMEFVVRELLQESPFLRKIYFVAPHFDREMQEYLVLSLGKANFDSRKIQLVEGTVPDCVSAFPEITSMFISNFSDFEEIYDHTPDALNGKMVVIADGYENMEIKPGTEEDKEPEMVYRGLDIFEKLHKEKRAECTYMFPYPIEKD